ncbi:MAG: hypothetical protein KKB30_06465 [Proteobacteria bacterium]|nr:hypothetical protein [Pseudomonadota bacterium]MBU1715163.1 hypothetical protein [Pseudomonadota bacterium]
MPWLIRLSVAVLFFALFLYSDVVEARPYLPALPLHIATEVQALTSGPALDKIEYGVRAAMTGADQFTLDFYPLSQQDKTLCRLNFQAAGLLTWQRSMAETPQPASQPLFLQPGFPLPVDILPVGQEAAQEKYEVKSSGGGRTFLKSYTVAVAEIAHETARQNGWLKVSLAPDALLHLYTVTDSNDNLVARQLWPAQADWWLFEETAFRRSWLIK